jgi:hypothetical protein
MMRKVFYYRATATEYPYCVHYADSGYADCVLLNVIMVNVLLLNVILLTIIVLTVVMVNVIMQNVLASIIVFPKVTTFLGKGISLWACTIKLFYNRNCYRIVIS